jgi:hypothetical protein
MENEPVAKKTAKVLGPSWNRFKGFSAVWRNRTIDLFNMLKILDLKRAQGLELTPALERRIRERVP